MERRYRSRSDSRRKKKRKPAYGERRVLDEFPRIRYLRFGDCIGEGHFSHVYQGTYHRKQNVAIKVIERGSERLIETEVELLNQLRGAPHVIQLLEVIESDRTLLVFELLNGIDSESIWDHFTINRLRYLLKSVLEALDAAHSLGIVHRDVKLSNILVSPHFNDVKLIDWGCGTYVGDEMSTKAGSRQCRPPEMLLGYRNYGTGCDIWAVGVLILYILSYGCLPWKARTAESALIKMSEFFGGNEIDKLAKRLNIEIDVDVDDEFYDDPQATLEDCFSEELQALCDPELVSLMKYLMTFDYRKRPTAKEALDHPFFKSCNK
ncbi:Casein kinase II subunit alpha' [Tritrichomonas foetus]|uniref:non-specific serine/threonine protein kinase n=1 Tax=Tritrichomonas foetus TaxID=1144522 RepID=A0A1J4J962_9EUKA|nr:Casein kinase II subunit alpha' [Tritrichomonas foetus]|eukprot:OHS95726.1 Casein kinase II subunit alpha' [Tritrichomonas foetus]